MLPPLWQRHLSIKAVMDEKKYPVETEKKHVRRKRYAGTHPKRYEEKYKELNPEKYQETVKKVMEKGSTPAGMHRSICVDEILTFLDIQPGQVGLDATLGYGGHTKEMAAKLQGKGHLFALDVDPIELPKTKARLEKLGFGEEVLTILNRNFRDLDEVGKISGPLDFVLADLGVSSMQIDNPERGFSFKVDGPLDLRLDPKKGVSGTVRLKSLTEEELYGMFVENADEPYAEVIAKAVIDTYKRGEDIDTTTKFKEVIEEALAFLPEKTRDKDIKKSCQRCFQALRIDVNSEFEVLYEFLEKLPQVMKEGGRIAILTFHSGEDRLVKKAFKQFLREGLLQEVARTPIRPSEEEIRSNGRARSAKLRWAVR